MHRPRTSRRRTPRGRASRARHTLHWPPDPTCLIRTPGRRADVAIGDERSHASDERSQAIVVGAGPNGLSAAVELARAGMRVTVYEAHEQIGGGTRTAALTLPGFRHDVCSAVHPMGASSPVFRDVQMAQHGLQWVHPEAPLAHPFDDGTAALLERSTAATADTLAAADRSAYRRLMDPLVANWP